MANSDTLRLTGTCRVEVHYKDANAALIYAEAAMTYVKAGMFCVLANGSVYKHPLDNVWRIKEATSAGE